MSAPRDGRGRFVKAIPDGAPNLPAAARASGVPGALGCDPLPEPVEAGGLLWTAEHCSPWSAPIGAALAAETAGAVTTP